MTRCVNVGPGYREVRDSKTNLTVAVKTDVFTYIIGKFVLIKVRDDWNSHSEASLYSGPPFNGTILNLAAYKKSLESPIDMWFVP